MADEGQSQGQEQEGQHQSQQQPPPQGGWDATAVQKMISETLQSGLSDYESRQEAARQEAAERQRVERESQGDVDPLAKVIAPIVGPAIQHVALQAQMAADANNFYFDQTPVGELKGKWRSEIESKASELARVGRAVSREDIFRWLVGGPKLSEYFEWESNRRQQAQEKAALAESAGAGSFRGAPGSSKKPLDQMDDAELAKIIDAVGA